MFFGFALRGLVGPIGGFGNRLLSVEASEGLRSEKLGGPRNLFLKQSDERIHGKDGFKMTNS